MTNELAELSGGDIGRSKALYDNLSRLAKEPDGFLREMANAVLKGEISLRDATSSDLYGSELINRFQGFWATYQQMTPEEREQLVARGQQDLDESATADWAPGP